MLAVVALSCTAPPAAAANLPLCSVTIHAVSEAGMVQSEPLVGPEHLKAVKETDGDAASGARHYALVLDEAGAGALAAHTGANVGRLLAVACDGDIVSQPVIRGVVRSPLMVTVDAPAGDAPGTGDLDSPRDVLAWVDLPRVVASGDEVTLTLTLRNARRDASFRVSSIDLGDGFLDGFEVLGIEPEPQHRDHSLGTLALEMPVDIAPDKEWSLVIRLRAKGHGVFVGDIDVWAGDRFLTRVAQIEVR